jgi:HTH-type transcriptional regulator / antitoxin HigA
VGDRSPAEVFPPGEYLRDELEARGWTQAEFAEIIGRPPRLVNEIIAGKRGITPPTAKEIGAALDTSALFWLNLEASYQLGRGDPPPPRIAREARVRGRFPIREMIRRGWIEPKDSPEELEAQVLRFFRIGSLDERPQLAYAARKADYAVPDSPTQEAWFARLREVAESITVPEYSEPRLREALIAALRGFLSEAEKIREVPRVLAQCGVRFVLLESLPGSKIDGGCCWLGAEADSPVVGMSLRFDRIDNFWFVLRHELEHVLRRDGRDGPVIDLDLDAPTENAGTGAELPEEERAANQAAVEFCVPQSELDDFTARVHHLYWDARIVGFAKKIGVHPGVVAGQLRKRANQYNILGRHLVKVRSLIISEAVSDGFGQPYPINRP